jgi:CDP-diacylglycerol--glycerol-3-phosphate 3-phosphatidyltransferase
MLARYGVTPNQITLSNIAVSIAASLVILSIPGAVWPLLLIPCALTVRLVFNHIDGLLACEHDMKSDLGALLNEAADVISDGALYLPLAAVPGVPARLILAAVFLGILTELIGLAALRIGADRREDGPMSKKPRGLVFSAIAVALGVGASPGPWLDWVLVATLPLLLFTVFRRIRNALCQVRAGGTVPC